MQDRWKRLACVATWVGLTLCAGCDSRGKAPTTRPVKTTATSTLIAPESLAWSREEAGAHLADNKLGISAAVRLIRLADLSPLCVPAELTDAHVRQLRLVHLAAERWALGLVIKRDEQRLRAAVLISVAGDVALPADGFDEELLVLCVSKDPEVFPHVALLPERVLLLDRDVTTAIVLEPTEDVHFELREQRGFSYIALVLLQRGPRDEVARYRWDPYEQTFLGPAVDVLPDPPGGKFRIDLPVSGRLEPVGGELPETRPIAPPRRRAVPAPDDQSPI